MLESLKPFELEITPRPRHNCRKCGNKLPGDPGRGYCPTCLYLLHSPDFPFQRYSNEKPPREVLEHLGLYPSFDQRQLDERIPNSRRVERWYDPDEPETTAFDRLLARALNPAA